MKPWNDYRSIIKVLHHERIYHGVTQADLAHKIGISESTLSKWEHGYRTPSIYNLLAWCDSLDIRLITEPYPKPNDS